MVRSRVVDHQMVADQIKGIAIKTGAIGAGEPLPQFAVENEVAEPLAGDHVVHSLREGEAERWCGRGETLAILHQNSVRGHADSFGARRSREYCGEMICMLR